MARSSCPASDNGRPKRERRTKKTRVPINRSLRNDNSLRFAFCSLPSRRLRREAFSKGLRLEEDSYPLFPLEKFPAREILMIRAVMKPIKVVMSRIESRDETDPGRDETDQSCDATDRKP